MTKDIRKTLLWAVLIFLGLWLLLLLSGGCKQASADPVETPITFEWTAQGDDGLIGQADTTVIKYALTEDSLVNHWAVCTRLDNIPPPLPSGQHETFVDTLLLEVQTPYYFALKLADDFVPANWSVLSNIAVVEIADAIPPTAPTDLKVTF